MTFKIGKFEIGSSRTFIIAEVGNNHNGDFNRAIQLVDRAIEIGVDCVKFQMRHLDEVYRKRSLDKSGEDLGTEYIVDLLKRFELSVEQHRELSKYCAKKGILYLCTPWDRKSVDVLETFGVLAYKVASADLTNLPLLHRLCETGKPLILSTGMSRREEIIQVTEFLKKKNAKFALLHCNSTYPAPLQDIHLRWIHQLKTIHPTVGYSGHERGIAVTLGAVALGAQVIERHLTLDRGMEGPDHAASLEVSEFKRLVEGVRELELALGNDDDRSISQGEMINRENLGKSLVAARPLKKGTVVLAEHVDVKSPGQGLSPLQLESLLGKTLTRDLDTEDFFFPSDLGTQTIQPKQYQFKHPWGIPVRYHDFEEYRSRIQPDLFEFHLSYSDLDLDIRDFMKSEYPQKLVVHAPELFEGSHLLDLASPDDEYRNRSIREMKRVVELTRDLNRYFPSTQRPMIVTNIGGFTVDETLPPSLITEYYERFAKSLKELDLQGVELIPQTMAPFPWHFGGQRHQNLFVKIEEIQDWCARLKLRMCFDVSHSRLTCNHFGIDFYDFAEKIAPFTAHIHMGDAKGVNGEGLQIGEGDMDFVRLGKILNSRCPDAYFIPEIWQGHKNGGEGFWRALEKLEGLM